MNRTERTHFKKTQTAFKSKNNLTGFFDHIRKIKEYDELYVKSYFNNGVKTSYSDKKNGTKKICFTS